MELSVVAVMRGNQCKKVRLEKKKVRLAYVSIY